MRLRFGIAVAGVHGQVAGVGDSAHAFTIQSIAKPFQFALVCEALGHREFILTYKAFDPIGPACLPAGAGRAA